MNNDFFKKFFRGDRKKIKTDIFVIFLLGVLVMIAAGAFSPKNSRDSAEAKPAEDKPADTEAVGGQSERQLEKRLEALLSQAEGVGNVKVMITLSASSEKILAKEVRTENRQNGNEQSEAAEETIVLSERSNESSPVVVMENMPPVEGVVVVAQGGGDIMVRDGIVKSAEALLGVPAHKIQVLKMK